MVQNGQKWQKWDKSKLSSDHSNFKKRTKMVQNGQKMVKNGQKLEK